MIFRWLKNYMPRGLYGRAALILVLPVILLQLLVSIVFIQRHFDGVTRLMTTGLSIELRYVRDQVDAAVSLDAARAWLAQNATQLAITSTLPAQDILPEDVKPFQDLTGRMVINTLRDQVPEVVSVSLADRAQVALWMDTVHGPLMLNVSRNRASAANPHQLLVIMVVIGGLMTAVAFFFLRNQLRPIKRMADAAADYGKGRITSFSPTGAVEVRAAGMAFLDMRNRIERQTQARTMMLSGVSHDLRTPLTRLRLGLSMIDGSEETAPLIRDVDEMQGLLDAFLDFARSDAGDTLAQADPRAIIATLLADAARTGQPVSQGEITGTHDTVALRPQAIRRALDNLVSNALRYGYKAQIGVSITDRAVRFIVEDDGPGIPVKDRDEAIKPFVRLDPSRNQDRGSGVGLGLAIVSDIARSHGGMLRLGESEALGGLKVELVLAR